MNEIQTKKNKTFGTLSIILDAVGVALIIIDSALIGVYHLTFIGYIGAGIIIASAIMDYFIKRSIKEATK
jgi:hypothetical protein